MTTQSIDIERATLLSYLDDQRGHVLGILDGLDDDTMHRSVLPSGWNCLELLHHLTFDVERFWFQCVAAGDEAAVARQPKNGWEVDPELSANDVIDRYQQEIARSNAVIAAIPLDAPPAWWPGDAFGDWRLHQFRQIILHVMTETATHAGHLDTVREIIDGRQWLVLT